MMLQLPTYLSFARSTSKVHDPPIFQSKVLRYFALAPMNIPPSAVELGALTSFEYADDADDAD